MFFRSISTNDHLRYIASPRFFHSKGTKGMLVPYRLLGLLTWLFGFMYHWYYWWRTSMGQFWAQGGPGIFYKIKSLKMIVGNCQVRIPKQKSFWTHSLIDCHETNHMAFDACLGRFPTHEDVWHGCPENSVLCTLMLLGGLMLHLLHGLSWLTKTNLWNLVIV